MNFRRLSARDATASARTRHNGAEQSPRPPHAATVTPAYAEGAHPWLPTTANALRAHAERCLGKAADTQTQIGELYDWIEHWRAEAADFARAADLIERDATASEAERTVRPGPAMGRDLLLNGWQPGLVDDLLHGGRAWHPDTRAGAQDGDTVPMRAVRTCITGVERDGVVYHCTSDEGHNGTHFNPRIGHFETATEAVAR